MKIKILGVSGSPRKGNTNILVNECLAGARELPNVETEFIHLVDYNLTGPCIACVKCVTDQVKGKLCHITKDGLNEILKQILAADGYIFGSPTYYGGESALMKIFLDRGRQGLSGASKEQGSTRYKPFGVVTCGTSRHGGQELTVFRIMRAFMFGSGAMLPVTPMLTTQPEGAAGFFGVTGQQGYPVGVPDLDSGSLEAVRHDEGAMNAAILLGRRVAEVAKIVKAGSALVTPEMGETASFPEYKVPQEVLAELGKKST